MEGQRKFLAAVLDSGVLFNASDKWTSIAESLYTLPDVIAEIKDVKTRDRLQLLLDTHQVKVMVPDASALEKVASMAKKTGDYAVLSRTDLRVLALAYMLEVKQHGSDHLRTEPMKVVTRQGGSSSDQNEQHKDEEDDQEQGNENDSQDGEVIEADDGCDEVAEELDQLSLNSAANEDQAPEDDDDGWITPSNLKRVKERDMQGKENVFSDEDYKHVVCMTTDFAMQNVLLHIGLPLASVDGYRISTLKTFVLRCHACFHVTQRTEKRFCPSCGGPTLLRTTCSIDTTTGQITLYLKRNYQYRLRGTKYAIPSPKTPRDPSIVLREDQKEFVRGLKHKQWEERKWMKQVDNVFDADYIPKMSLGIQETGKERKRHDQGSTVIGYGRRNPNESRRRIGKRKKGKN